MSTRADAFEELLRRRRIQVPMAHNAPSPGPVARGARVPLSFAQQRLWLQQQLEPESPLFNMPAAMRLRAPMDEGALERTFREIARRHEVLRTTCVLDGDEPVQVIGPVPRRAVRVVDLSGLEEDAREARLAEIVHAEARRPFDLATQPPLRAGLVRMGPDDAVLLYTVHHIAGDQDSARILAREAAALYGAFSRGMPSPLPELPLQYADYALWQRAWLSGEVLAARLAYWGERLRGAPRVLDLPTDRPRPAVRSAQGRGLSFQLPAGTVEGLRALGRREQATPFMIFLAAYQLLLAHYAGQEDVCVGTPAGGRTHVELEPLAGLFVNVVVLRTDLSGNPDVGTLLGRARETTLGAQAHNDLPFEKLVDELGVERSAAYHPLFQSMLTFASATGRPAPLRMGGAAPERVPTGSRTVKFDLVLNVFDDGQGMSGYLEYRTDLFDHPTIERMAGHLAALLEGMATRPGERISTLSLLAPGERALLLGAWSGTPREHPADGCVHQWVARQAARTPDAVAVVFAGERLTYRELEARANRVANRLRSRGIGPGAFVPFRMERGTGVVVAMLGILRAGAAFVPLGTDWPAERIRRSIEELGSGVALVAGGADAAAAVHPAEALDVGGEGDAGDADGAETDPQVPAGPEDAIYAIYTSGSTGVPKAAIVPHRGIANRIRWMNERLGAESAAAVLQTTPHVYDSAVWQVFWPLVNGGTTVIPEAGREVDAAYVAGTLQAHGITTTDFVPSVFNALAGEIVGDGASRARLASLRYVILGGEEITPGTTYRFMRHLPHVRVVNLYGPTEASIGCVFHEVAGTEGERIPIGRPITGARALVLDAHRRPVPAGVVGELYLGGECVGLGYLGDGEKTARSFVESPFPEVAGRLYRTGDRVRWLADGALQFLGRVDNQVKIHGVRIEPGEIEAQLRRHPSVRTAIVAAHAGRSGERRLVAWAEAADATGGALREFLAERLPRHLVPVWIGVMEAFPRTAGGKVDRGALPAPDPAAGGEAFVAPRTLAEEIVAGTWGEMLRVERVGVEDDFFALGGHSLVALQTVSRLRRAFGIDLPLRAIFDAPTVAGLAAYVDRQRAVAAGTTLPPVRRVPRDGAPFPLSAAQHRLWALDQAAPERAAFNLSSAVRLWDGFDPIMLQQALSELVRRQESLRTMLLADGAEPLQVILPAGEFPLPVVDLSGLGEADREAAVRRLAGEESRRPFRPGEGPLFRAALLQLAEAEWILLRTVHHLATDGWSQRLLESELRTLYEAFAAGAASPLAELPVQYADYVAWEREHRGEAWLSPLLHFWKTRLEGIWPLRLAGEPSANAWVSDRSARQTFTLPAELAAAVRALGRTEGSTAFVTLLAAFTRLLARRTGRTDVVVGTPVAGRGQVELEGIVGFFANSVVLRTDLSGDPAPRDVLRRVRETVLEAFAHGDVPIARVTEALAGPGGPAPLYHVVFELERGTPGEPGPAGAEAAPEEGDGGGTLRFDLRVTVRDDGEGISVRFAYRADLYTYAFVRGLVEEFVDDVAAVVAAPELPVPGTPGTTPGEAPRPMLVLAGPGSG